MTLSSKVAVALSLAVALVGALATTLAIDRQSAERRREFRETNREAVELLALAIAPALAEASHHQAQNILDNIANFPERYPDIRSLQVVDLRGRVFADLDPQRFGDPALVPSEDALAAQQPTTTEVGRGELEVSVPVRLAHPLGLLRARVNEARLDTALARQQRAAGILLLGTLFVLGLLLYALHRRLLGAPIAALARTAARLRAGGMDARAEVRGDDELALLGRAFNEMASHLDKYTGELESAVSQRTAQLEQANKRLEELARTDALTALSNRRHFEDCTGRALEAARRGERPMAVIVADVDRFKSYNDRYGHAVGDAVLRDLAQVLRDGARSMDLVARIGGEEFAIGMPEATAQEAVQAAERARTALAARAYPSLPGEERPTASFGVAAFPEHGSRLDDLLGAADGALYEAKRLGRDRVCLAPSPPPRGARGDG